MGPPTISPAAGPAVKDRTLRRPHHFPELDALRGVAAFVVVLGHFALLWEPSTLTPRLRFLLEGPLLPLFNGTSSVILFFLLSGFVLSLPYKRGTQPPASVFLLRRLARIYLPYLAALALALLGDWQLHQPIAVSRWFSHTWTAALTSSLILQHVLLLGNYDTAQVNTAFWSLAVEMRLSLVFPLLCLPLLRWSRAFALIAFAGAVLLHQLILHLYATRLDPVSLTNLSEMTFGTLSFCAGILLARWLESARALWGRAGTLERLLLFALSFLSLEWSGAVVHLHFFGTLSGMLTIAGGCGILVTALCSTRASRILNHRLPAWLGRISYSLYLVHGTVLFALTHLLLGRLTRLDLLLPYLIGSLGVAALFFFLVEKPCISLSRSIGRRHPAHSLET